MRVASLNELIRVSNQQNLQAPNVTKQQPATCKNQKQGPNISQKQLLKSQPKQVQSM